MNGEHAHFHFLGVPVRAAPVAPAPFVAIGLAIYAVARWLRVPQPVQTAVFGALVWLGADWLHTAGHIISARQAGVPMDYIDWTFMPVNGYHTNDLAPEQHLGRAVGGPIGSAAGVALFLPLWRLLGPGLLKRVALVGLIANAVLLLGALVPLPFIDGGVLWPNLRKLRER